MSDNYTLGRGIVYLSLYDDQGNLKAERDVGNAPELNFNVDISTLEHFSSRSGIKSKDKEIVTEVKPSLSFILDEMNVENLRMFFLGDAGVKIEQAAETGVTNTINANFKKYVDLSKREVSNVVVKNSDDTVTFVENTDYIVDYKSGSILALSSGSITDNQELNVTFNNDACNYVDIEALKTANFEAQLRYVSDNPVGPEFVFLAWKVMIKPDGDLSLIGSEEISTLSFNAEILKDEANHPSNPYIKFTVITAN